jgi:hypothetical protein
MDHSASPRSLSWTSLIVLTLLADDDRTGRDGLAVADLHAEALANRVATVLRA